MRTVTFNLRADLSDAERASILDRIRHLAKVRQVSLVKPGAGHPQLQRLCFAWLDEDSDELAVATHIASLPDVESVSVPAERRLVIGDRSSGSP